MAYGGRIRGSALAYGLGMALSWSCSGSSAEPMNSTSGDPVEVPPWACVPGEAQPCPCPELEGLRTCNPDGSGFGECDCSPGAVSQGPPPTSTGGESGTSTASDTAGTGDTTMGSATTGEPDPGTSSGAPEPGTTTSGSSSG